MTDQEMTASELRAINWKLAVKVMGWTDDVEGSGHYYDHRYSRPIDYHDWNPTTNPADAMAVLKRVLEKSPSFAVERVAPELSATGNVAYECGSFENGIYYPETVVVEPTLETAISLFALKIFS